ncbi:hypothetical protein [Pseudomonas oryzihabitans]|uniref:Uncharacterized protein n=1 Tax=Pseudomonas oryzihabitans TaxID=47885 RepID=A0ABX3IRX9_9PSED|nr:hypothetical protein [Pseudomonas psychrotolerans]ONN71078.1 hypothetical protein BVL52_11280 [Pseudomonas psychrotolerans]
MGIEDNEFETLLKLISQLNLNMVMDQGRADSGVMSRIINALEERGVDNRTDEENGLFEWARYFQRLQGTGHD